MSKPDKLTDIDPVKLQAILDHLGRLSCKAIGVPYSQLRKASISDATPLAEVDPKFDHMACIDFDFQPPLTGQQNWLLQRWLEFYTLWFGGKKPFFMEKQ